MYKQCMLETPKNLFYTTLIISVIFQIITGAIELSALYISDVPKEQNILRQVLAMELGVQSIEAVFYGWLITNLNTITNVTPKRYLDWIVTTPIMLFSLIVYLIYLNYKNKSELSLFNIFKTNFSSISYIFILNWAMLLFGYLGEMNVIPTITGVAIGFVPFLMYFYEIYRKYVGESGTELFWYFFVFWSLYGVVAILPYYLKNAFYNILDLFSKNFFGLFISYLILTKSY